MAKIPDFTELTKKLDLQGIMDTVKSAIGTAPPAKAPEGDEIAAKFVEIITAVQQAATVQAEQVKALGELNIKLNALYKDVMAYKAVGTDSAGPQCSIEKPVTKEKHEP